MGKNNIPATENSEKKMTKYDRKMLARKEAEIREKRQRKMTRITAAVIIALIAVVAIAVPVGRQIRVKSEYIRIGGHSINKIEYDFMSGYFTNYTRSMYTYFGMIDGTKSLSLAGSKKFVVLLLDIVGQALFLCVVDQNKALADAVNRGLVKILLPGHRLVKVLFGKTLCAVDHTEISVHAYLKANFGSYASKSSLKDILTQLLTASAHNDYLLEQNKPSDEAVESYYAENKNSYDTINFNLLELKAEIAEGASEEDDSGDIGCGAPFFKQPVAVQRVCGRICDVGLQRSVL